MVIAEDFYEPDEGRTPQPPEDWGATWAMGDWGVTWSTDEPSKVVRNDAAKLDIARKALEEIKNISFITESTFVKPSKYRYRSQVWKILEETLKRLEE